MTVVQAQPDGTSIVARIYESPDYLDRYIAEVDPGRFETVDDVAHAWFIGQPAWLRLLSTNAVSARRLSRAIATGRFQCGTSVGSWEVIDRNTEEIVFGESMGFMQYRFSFRLVDPGGSIEAATAVKYLWPRTGPLYFTLVKPFHRKFINLVLARTASSAGAVRVGRRW